MTKNGEYDQCVYCGMHGEHDCKKTEVKKSEGWCCELCGGLIKGECMMNEGFVIHKWGSCIEDERLC